MKVKVATPSDSQTRHRIFETAMGWTWFVAVDLRIVRIELPQATKAKSAESLKRAFPDSIEDPKLLPKTVRELADYFAGKKVQFTAPIALERVTPFQRRVYEGLLRLAPGEVVGYGELARRIGSPGAARSVGTALSRNPFPPIVPCHRVITASSGLGGFSAAGGLDQKARLLVMEGAECPAARKHAEMERTAGSRRRAR